MIILGDLHFKKAEPYFSGLKKLCSWLVENYKGQTLLLSGDVLDTSSEPWHVIREFIEFIQNFDTHIIHGNHEYSRLKGSALSFFHTYENIRVYTKATETEIKGHKWLMLPYRYIPEEISAYSNLKSNAQFTLAHVSPPGMNGGREEVDLSNLNRVFYGHLHIADDWKQNHTILRVPQPTRQGEQFHNPRLFEIKKNGTEKEILLPVFMTIEDIDYEVNSENLNPDNLYNILNAPSIQAAESKYKYWHIRRSGITLNRKKNDKIDISQTKENIKKSIEEKWKNFANEKKKDQEIIDLGLKYLGGIHV